MRQIDEHGMPPDAPRPRPALSWLALGATVITVVLLARTLLAYPLMSLRLPLGGASGTPTLVTTQQDSGVPGLTLQNIVMVSQWEGWAAGWRSALDGTGATHPVLLHWNGTDWSSVAAQPGNGFTGALAALPNGDVWAAANNTIFRLANGTWTPSYIGENEGDNTYTTITGLAMLSPSEGWATGVTSDPNGNKSFILRYHAGEWIQAKIPYVPDATTLRSLSMSADGSEGWAVGSRYGNSGEVPFALHYLNNTWFEDDGGLPGAVNAVATVRGGDAWAVGITSGNGPGYIVHWHFTAWQRVNSPTPNQLHAISMLSDNEGYIAGDGAATLHYVNGYANGAWQQEGVIIHGLALSGISMTAPGEGWAVGGGVMLREHNGTWSVYTLSL